VLSGRVKESVKQKKKTVTARRRLPDKATELFQMEVRKKFGYEGVYVYYSTPADVAVVVVEGQEPPAPPRTGPGSPHRAAPLSWADDAGEMDFGEPLPGMSG